MGCARVFGWVRCMGAVKCWLGCMGGMNSACVLQ